MFAGKTMRLGPSRPWRSDRPQRHARLPIRAGVWLLCSVVVWGVGTPAVRAGLVIELDSANSGLSGFTGPYGSVTIDLTDSTHATITFQNNIVGGNEYLFGGQGAVAVDVNASSFSMSDLTGVDAFSGGILSDGGSNQEDGFGVFNQTIDAFDGYTHSFTSVSFKLTDLKGTWSSAKDVLTNAGSGINVAAHIFVASTSLDPNAKNVPTGYASDGVNSTPEPTSLALWSMIGLGSIAYGRRRHKRTIA